MGALQYSDAELVERMGDCFGGDLASEDEGDAERLEQRILDKLRAGEAPSWEESLLLAVEAGILRCDCTACLERREQDRMP